MQLPSQIQVSFNFLLYWSNTFNKSNCRAEAAALTFFTLLAIAPLVVILAKLVSIIPNAVADIRHVQDLLFTLLVPESAAQIKDYLTNFTLRANTITLAGAPLLLFSILGLMNQLGIVLTRIFNMKPRKIWVQIPYSFAALLFGPILLSLLFSAAAWVRHLSFIGWIPWNLGADIISLVVQVIVASVFFVLVPSKRLPYQLVFLGGFLLVIGQNGLRIGFAQILGSISNYEVLYGIFAAIPLFLIWVYSCWLLLLIISTFLQTIRVYQNKKLIPT